MNIFDEYDTVIRNKKNFWKPQVGKKVKVRILPPTHRDSPILNILERFRKFIQKKFDPRHLHRSDEQRKYFCDHFYDYKLAKMNKKFRDCIDDIWTKETSVPRVMK